MELTNKDILNNQALSQDNSEVVVDKDIKKEKVDFVENNKKGIDLDKIKFILFPFILVVIGVAVIGFVTYPKIQEYYANLTIVKTKLAEITKLSDKLKVLQQFSTVGNVLEENSAVLTKAIPNEQTVPQFMTLVQTISKNSGVELKSLTYSGTAPTSEKSSFATSGLSEIELVYIQGSAVGDYNSIKTFTRNLESSMRIMNIDNIRLTSDGSSAEDQSKVNLSFAITAYSAIIKAQAVAEQPLNFNLTDGNFSKVLDFLKSQNDYNVDVSNVGIGKPDPFSN